MLKTTGIVLTKALMPFGPGELKQHITNYNIDRQTYYSVNKDCFVYLLYAEQLFTTVSS